MKEPLNYTLTAKFDATSADSKTIKDTLAILDERALTLKPGKLQSKSIPYFKILKIDDEDYSVVLKDISGETIKLTQIGYEYENFLLNLYKNRGEQLLRYTLMDEKNLAKDIAAHFAYTDEEGNYLDGACEARIYESAIVILPKKADPIRIPLCYIQNHVLEDYVTKIESSFGEQITLTMMGEKTDYLTRVLSKAMKDMYDRATNILNEAAPGVSQGKIMEAARILGDGIAASKKQLETISPELWRCLENMIKQTDIGEEYTHLAGRNESDVWIGLKRGLMGERTGSYVWFIVPIYDLNPAKPGNAVVLEATSSEEVGRATYLFRMMDRPAYNSGLGIEEMKEAASSFIRKANRCMIEINFRREPIYLAMERLNQPEYEQYLYAANKLKPLQFLRERYIGRVAHTTIEQWKNNLGEFLKFNVESQSDSDKWR